MGRMEQVAEFRGGQPVDMAEPAAFHSLDQVTRFLQTYLDCELALVAPASGDGACALRGGISGSVDGGRRDTLADPATARSTGMRFYAGLPLRDRDGRHLGIMAAMDGAERPLSGEQLQTLRRLAGVAAHLCGPTRHD